jgi:hypothetical protein
VRVWSKCGRSMLIHASDHMNHSCRAEYLHHQSLCMHQHFWFDTCMTCCIRWLVVTTQRVCWILRSMVGVGCLALIILALPCIEKVRARVVVPASNVVLLDEPQSLGIVKFSLPKPHQPPLIKGTRY